MTYFVSASDPDFDGDYETLDEAVQQALYWSVQGSADVGVFEVFDWRRCLTADEREHLRAHIEAT